MIPLFNRRKPVLLFAIAITATVALWNHDVTGFRSGVEDIANLRPSLPNSGIRSKNTVSTDILLLTRQPWSQDDACQKFHVGFVRDFYHPPMALVSFPGSGNTWIRQLIENLSGYFTGSIYRDIDLYIKGLYGEMVPAVSGYTIVQKTHDYPVDSYCIEQPNFNTSRGILIIRNPYKAIVSLQNHSGRKSDGKAIDHQGTADRSAFQGTEWETFIKDHMYYWESITARWIQNIKKGGIIYYEKLLTDREQQLRRLSKLLDLEVDEERLNCVLQHDPVDFKRNRSIIFDPFTKEHRAKIDSAIFRIQKALKKRHFEPLPLHLYDFFNQSNPQRSI